MMSVSISSTNLPICEGQSLELTFDDLPLTGVNNFFVQYSINGVVFSHTGPQDGFGMIMITSPYTGNLAQDGLFLKMDLVNQDPTGSPMAIGVDGTNITMEIDELPDGLISLTTTSAPS